MTEFPPGQPWYIDHCTGDQKYHNSQTYPLAWRRPLTATADSTWEAGLCAKCFFLLRNLIHDDILTLFTFFWPPVYCLRKGT